MKHKWLSRILRAVSYLLVAAAASCVTLLLFADPPSKLDNLQALIEEKFIGQVDSQAIQDAAADAMVNALGDRWSYYIPAEEYASYEEGKKNSYVGVGMTITVREDDLGFDILRVEPGGSAQAEGILPGDILTQVEGQPVTELGTAGASELIRGQVGTTVSVTVLRDGETLTFQLERRQLQVAAAKGQLLEGNIGYVKIVNFNENCADQTISAIEDLLEQGAQALVFDVRNNPGGYKDELVEVLDYLLPEGVLFRSESESGAVTVDESDAQCLELPMAVLINSESYSAAEFFAAALEEYDWAVTVGDPTCGKGYFQNTFLLGDGSAVGLSVGKYTTPNGVSLAETGGLTPEILVEVDEETAALIYAEAVEPADDPQLQAAAAELAKSGKKS